MAMDIIKHVISCPTMADLRTLVGTENSVALLLGGTTPGDSKAGIYRWVSSTGTDSLAYMEKITVTGNTTGYWSRVFINTTVYPQGVLVRSGMVKTLYSTATYTTDANGEATFYMTEENTLTGTPIFTEIWSNTSRVVPPATSSVTANDLITGTCKIQAANLKSTTHAFTRGNAQSFSIGALVSTLGLRAAPSGVSVQFTVVGI